jgi:hypothetical protein
MSSRFLKDYRSPYHDEPRPQFIYIDYELENNDTLLSLSIKFGVSIGDLKRINVIQNDRELSALKLIRIPIKPNSIHTETFKDRIKYSDQVVTRLNTSLPYSNLEIDYFSDNGSANVNSDDDKSQTDETVTTANLIGLDSHGTLIAQTDFIDEDPTISLLNNTNDQPKIHKSKQAKEVKKLLKQFDNNLESLKTQNNELYKQTELLVPIQTCSYIVESRNSLLVQKKKGILNFNLRDTLILACIIVVLAPLLFLIYRYTYIKEHTELQQQP